MEYYLGMKKNEIWPFAATWIDRISQTKMNIICH